MFQDGQLFDHLTVARNVGYALRLRRVPDLDRRVAELLDLVGLAGVRRPAAGNPLRRRAAAGRPGALAGRRAAAAAARRAALGARRRAARAAGGRPARHPRGGRHDRPAGHPRPRGGVRGGRPARRDALRPDRPAGSDRATSGAARSTPTPPSSSGTPSCSTATPRPGCCGPPVPRTRRPWRCAGPRWRSPTTGRCRARVVSSRLTPDQVRLRLDVPRARGAGRRRRARHPRRAGRRGRGAGGRQPDWRRSRRLTDP